MATSQCAPISARFHLSVAVVCKHKYAQTQNTLKNPKVTPVRCRKRNTNTPCQVKPRPTCRPTRCTRQVLQKTQEHGHFVPQCARHTHCSARVILCTCAATLYKCFVFCVLPPPSRAVICPGRAAWCITTWQVLHVRSVAVFCVDAPARLASNRRFHHQNTVSTRFSLSIRWHTHATLDVGVPQQGHFMFVRLKYVSSLRLLFCCTRVEIRPRWCIPTDDCICWRSAHSTIALFTRLVVDNGLGFSPHESAFVPT